MTPTKEVLDHIKMRTCEDCDEEDCDFRRVLFTELAAKDAEIARLTKERNTLEHQVETCRLNHIEQWKSWDRLQARHQKLLSAAKTACRWLNLDSGDFGLQHPMMKLRDVIFADDEERVEKKIELTDWIECDICGGSGVNGHDCGEDTCCCLDRDENVHCACCDGMGGWVDVKKEFDT